MPSVADFDRFLFVVGAPRCGTTTLAHFLKCNPAVSRPTVKEPHFFAQNDLRRLSDSELQARVEDEYLKRFFGDGPAGRIGMDASVTYLYMPEQLEPVLRLWPESRFVISVRDPLAMLPSLHRRLIYIGDETLGNFEEAWAAVPERRAGRRIPRRCADPRWLFYDEAARFSTYLERLFSVVGRERCLVLLFDDLAADPEREYRRLMEFSGLKPDAQIDVATRRASYTVRSRWLQRVLKRPPAPLRELLGGAQLSQRFREVEKREIAAGPRKLLSLRKRLLEWNRDRRPTEGLSPAMQDEICREFGGEVERLSSMLGRNLDQWLRRAG